MRTTASAICGSTASTAAGTRRSSSFITRAWSSGARRSRSRVRSLMASVRSSESRMPHLVTYVGCPGRPDLIPVLGPPVSHPQARIQEVAEAVADEIEAEHDQGDRRPREDGGPRGKGHEPAGFGEHVPPGRRGGLRAEAEEAQG